MKQEKGFRIKRN